MFRFKQFTIHQDRCAMKVGTDGVLLGAWAMLEQAERILDIGTGLGLIALMAAQRNPSAQIDAIEIEPQAYMQAQENVSASPWPGRIRLHRVALQEFEAPYPFDCIVCNPPFFVNSTKTPDENRTLARHSDTLPHTELAGHAARLLAPGGNFCVILPVNEANEFIRYAQGSQLYPTRVTRILPTPEKTPKRKLIQFTKWQKPCNENDLIIELSRHQYSEEYIRLTRSFYLSM